MYLGQVMEHSQDQKSVTASSSKVCDETLGFWKVNGHGSDLQWVDTAIVVGHEVDLLVF